MTRAPWDVRRSGDRFRTRTAGVDTRHSFSFGSHYDPANTGHALLVAHNDDRLAVGAGYPLHPHRDVEIVTWVLSGALRHEDSDGRSGVVEADGVQRMSAGAGIRHSEWNDAATGAEARFVQMWVLPRTPGGTPSYAEAEVPGGDLVTLASGLPRVRSAAVLEVRSDAALHLVRPRSGRPVELPEAPYLHVFAVTGEVTVEGVGTLGPGDAARLTEAGGARLAVTQTDARTAVLVWEMHAAR